MADAWPRGAQVTQADARKALEENFGGEDENPPAAPGYGSAPAFKFTKYSNAYMLVYIRASDWDQARGAGLRFVQG